MTIYGENDNKEDALKTIKSIHEKLEVGLEVMYRSSNIIDPYKVIITAIERCITNERCGNYSDPTCEACGFIYIGVNGSVPDCQVFGFQPSTRIILINEFFDMDDFLL